MTLLRGALLLLLLPACGAEVRPPSEDSLRTRTRAMTEAQGQQMQGQQMQGQQMQGTVLGAGSPGLEPVVVHRLSGVTLGGDTLEGVRVEQGGLVAERRVPGHPDRETLRGAQLIGAELTGEDGATTLTRFRITAVRPELAAYDSQGTGDTFLYTVERRTPEGTWVPMCGSDASGLRAAIPVGAVFDATGARQESTTHFTLGCTAGVIAKCYRWGYKPWLAHPGGPALMRDMHWACTRMARADYCGNGISHTRNGTLINLWDTLPAPGPIQARGEPALGMVFEAGWDTSGAVCLSKARWLTLPPDVVALCPERLIPPGLSTGLGTLCESSLDALALQPRVRLFNESQLNLLP
ncbi:MAG TPA: ADYC domain-containing protein [Myxococcus sp.]|nr:ADYC domain-containing protein [Myxococcus sp.]